jgi:hypothetical protein
VEFAEFGQPAHGLGQALIRIAILLILVPGFFATAGAGFWLEDKWFGPLNQGPHRMTGLILSCGLAIYIVVAFLLMQFW